jgi:predicted ribosomally synthesized peptide with nif11-like leader
MPMKSLALTRFLDAVARDPVLQGQCGSAASLAQLVAVAQAAGFAVEARDLQLWAHGEAFQAPWWPWAGRDRAARTAFFRR